MRTTILALVVATWIGSPATHAEEWTCVQSSFVGSSWFSRQGVAELTRTNETIDALLFAEGQSTRPLYRITGALAITPSGGGKDDLVEGTIKATIFPFDSGTSEAAYQGTYLM